MHRLFVCSHRLPLHQSLCLFIKKVSVYTTFCDWATPISNPIESTHAQTVNFILFYTRPSFQRAGVEATSPPTPDTHLSVVSEGDCVHPPTHQLDHLLSLQVSTHRARFLSLINFLPQTQLPDVSLTKRHHLRTNNKQSKLISIKTDQNSEIIASV